MIPAIIVCSCIVGLYLIIVLICVSQLVRTNHKLKRREHTINVILAQKYDLLVTLGKFMEANNAKLPNNIKEALIFEDYMKLNNISTQERMSIKTLLMNTLSTMFYIAEENGLQDNPRYITLKNSIKEIDTQHRKQIALYNADATAYNYWVKAILFRPFAKLFRLKDKEVIY